MILLIWAWRDSSESIVIPRFLTTALAETEKPSNCKENYMNLCQSDLGSIIRISVLSEFNKIKF